MLLNAGELEFIYSMFAIFAALCSSSILVTVVMFPDMMKQLFTKIIMYILFCTMVANIMAAFGFPDGDTRMCTTQAILVNLFFKASWFWTTCLSHEIYSLFIYEKHGLTLIQMHAICWSLAIFFTMIPLTTSSFGRSDDLFTEGWCFLRTKTSFQEILWSFVTFYSPLTICIILMIYFSIRIHLKYKDFNLQIDDSPMKTVVDSMFLYPICLIVTWGPILVVSILANFEILEQNADFASTYDIVTIFATQTGSFITIIFFWKSAEARYRWYTWLYGIFGYCYCWCCCCDTRVGDKSQGRLTSQTNVESALTDPLLSSNSNTEEPFILRTENLRSDQSNLHFFRTTSFEEGGYSVSDVYHRSQSGSYAYGSGDLLHDFMGGFISPPLSLSGQSIRQGGEYIYEDTEEQLGVVPTHFHSINATSGVSSHVSSHMSSRVSSHDSFDNRVLSSLLEKESPGES